VRPDTISLTDLLELLRRFNTATVATSLENGLSPDEVFLSLPAISQGSAVLTLRANERTFKNASRVVDAIARRDASLIPPMARRALHDVWKKAQKRSWAITIQPSNGVDAPSSAVIDPNVTLFSTLSASGSTSVLAYIVRAGGENPPTATIRVQGERLTVPVAGQDIAERLGGLLYQFVELHGQAVWSTNDGRLVDFRIRELGPYSERRSDPRGALDELATASGGYWDTIDPDDYMRDQRGD
jgi:hypothetical protein